jgi:hypothetical protein
MIWKTSVLLTALVAIMLAAVNAHSEPQVLENLRGRQAINPEEPGSLKPLPTLTKDCVEETDTEIFVKCNFRLQPSQVILKKLIVEGQSGITIDCNGAILDGGKDTPNEGKDMIEVRSKLLIRDEKKAKAMLKLGRDVGKIWQRSADIKIRKCNIVGSVRIKGMGNNGEGEFVTISSRLDANHIARVQSAAPTRIALENLTIIATDRTPLYLAPGVTHVTLTGSELRGNATRTAIYLDAESAYNVIRDNYIHVKIFREWKGFYNLLGPQISIDTSSHNKIISNRFAAIEGGGIYTFRNCGEGGTVRHGSSSHNQIINNVFFYDKYLGFNPAIHIGSRGEWWRQFGNCGTDENRDTRPLYDNPLYDPNKPEGKFPWGSSASDDDNSKHNIIMQNRIYKRPVDLMIKQGDSSNRPNLIAYNETVKEAEKRPAGCYLANGLTDFLKHGESSDLVPGKDGIPRCTGKRQTCNDGRLSSELLKDCRVQRKGFECRITGTNADCRQQPSCLGNKSIIAARAACNLEGGMVSQARLQAVSGNMISVVRPSDDASDGKCWVAETSLQKGTAKIVGALNRRSVEIGCHERDSNGGDCHIRGMLYCH